MRGLRSLSLAGLAALLGLGAHRSAQAHCDSMDGPVVTAARAALEKSDVTPLLRWVAPDREAELRAAFEKGVAARRGSAEAREVADLWFFETLVRIHRAGEGEPYTGLQPAGTPPAPGVREADEALEKNDVDALAQTIGSMVADGVRARFQRAVEARKQAESSVESGRRFVAAYVEFMHYVERAHELGAGHASPHHAESPGAGEGHK